MAVRMVCATTSKSLGESWPGTSTSNSSDIGAPANFDRLGLNERTFVTACAAAMRVAISVGDDGVSRGGALLLTAAALGAMLARTRSNSSSASVTYGAEIPAS